MLFHLCFLQFYCIYFWYHTSWIIIDKMSEIKTNYTGKFFFVYFVVWSARLCEIYINGQNVPKEEFTQVFSISDENFEQKINY